MFSESEIQTLCAAIAHRRSLGLARIDADKPVERRLVERLLVAADWAPSHGETEPWRFTVYTGAARQALGAAFAQAYRESVAGGQYNAKTFEAQKERPLSAPIWIALGVAPARNADGLPRMDETEEIIAVGCAVQNLHLVASASGLAGMWLSGGVMTHPHVARFVGLESPDRLLGFFFLGWPRVAWPAGERRPLAEKVRWHEEDSQR